MSKILSIEVKRLSGFFEKLLGLSFQKNAKPIYFETRYGIHTFFVRTPIDVIVCDSGMVVRKIALNLKPWRMFFWNPEYKNIIESPAGYLNLRHLKPGQKLHINVY